ncbi:hypothetical protein Efla_004313 [Eimeria flavescens]
MTGLRLIAVVGASLLLLQAGGATTTAGSSKEKKLTGTYFPSFLAERVDCLKAMNAARAKAGLSSFQALTAEDGRIPIADAGTGEGPKLRETSMVTGKSGDVVQSQTPAEKRFLTSFCSALTQTGTPKTVQTATNGTYMYAPGNSVGESSCISAVDYWLEAEGNFTTLPPPYEEYEPLYKDHRNISFVGLLNTSSDPKVDCALITCNEADDDGKNGEAKPEQQPPPSNNSSDPLPPPGEVFNDTAGEDDGHKGDDADSRRRLKAAEDPVYSLVCLTTPQALELSKAPFTQDQWKKIKGIQNSSAEPRAFAVFALVAAALVHSSF